MIKIYDIATTSQGSYRLLRTRVKKINRRNDISNSIICPPGYWTELIKDEGIDVIEFPMVRNLTLGSILTEFFRLFNLFAQKKPDIIHTHNSKAGGLARIAAWLCNLVHQHKIIIIHQVHGFYFTQLTGLQRAVYEWIERILSWFTDCILFQNQYEFKWGRSHLWKKTILRLIGNGINFEEFNGHLSKKKKATLGVKKIIHIARIEPVKNHELAIQSIRSLMTRYPNDRFQVAFIGEGVHEHLGGLLVADNLANHVRFTGPLDRDAIIRHLLQADISILTSIKEGMPRVLIESMLFAIPCVATKVIGTEELIQNGYNGYLVPLGDSEAFADRLHNLISDETLWREMSSNARRQAERHYNEDTVIGRIVEIYRSFYYNQLTVTDSEELK